MVQKSENFILQLEKSNYYDFCWVTFHNRQNN